jgi:gas vesicle protein
MRTTQDLEHAHGNGFFMGLVLGAAVGATLGLLLTPKTGADMRRALSDSASRIRRRAGETYSGAERTVSHLVDKGRQVIRQGRERVEDAVGEARAAYAEETSAHRDPGASRPY